MAFSVAIPNYHWSHCEERATKQSFYFQLIRRLLRFARNDIFLGNRSTRPHAEARPCGDCEATELVFRPMELRDLDTVEKMEKKIFRDPWTRSSFAFEILGNPRSRPIVAEKDGHVIAYAVYWRLDSEAHLANFAVDENHRRRKVGQRLLTQILQELKGSGVQVVHLEVRRSNVAAQKLYSKFGFKIQGIRKHYYVRGKEDALLMSLSLEEG